MPAYFHCSLCHRITVMHQLRARCPECGSRSGEFSCERPRDEQRHYSAGNRAAPSHPASGRHSRRVRDRRVSSQSLAPD